MNWEDLTSKQQQDWIEWNTMVDELSDSIEKDCIECSLCDEMDRVNGPICESL